ncbi:MAG TPA: DUF5676 family membrane protein [Albitalea sp.]|uniref:DUF5676 family membrane protein n=1 Tax=Piscinibacter sp. TaxID=1903157 RepID=UPI002ED55110
MATLPLALQHDAPASQPLRMGIAFAATVALFYTLCMVVWLAAPGPFMSFMNSLFHGMDFTPLLKPARFSWGGFVSALVVMAAWAFFAASFFAWLRQRLG